MLYIPAIVRRVDQTRAGGGTTFDLVLQAGSGTIVEKTIITLADPEQALAEMECAAGRTGAWEGSEVSALAGAWTSVVDQPGEGFVGGEIEVWITLVVPEDDVVTWLELLDQVVFQQEGFHLGMGYRHLNISDLLYQRPSLGGVVIFTEITPYPLFEIAGLADVNHPTLAIEHPIYACFPRKITEKWSIFKFFHFQLDTNNNSCILSNIS